MTIDVETEQGRFIWGNERVLWRGALACWFRRVGIQQELVRYYRVFPSNVVFEPLFELEQHISNQWFAPLFTHYNFVGRKT